MRKAKELPIATQSQNTINFAGDRSDRKSGKRGVRWNIGNQKWESVFCVNGKTKSLGLFDSIEDAYEIASKKRKEVFGEFWESRNG